MSGFILLAGARDRVVSFTAGSSAGWSMYYIMESIALVTRKANE